MSNKFKVGDRVKLLKGVSKANHPIHQTRFAPGMESYVGLYANINGVYDNGNYTVTGNEWAWLEDWLELVPEVNVGKREFYKGDYIVIFRGGDLGAFRCGYCYKMREQRSYLVAELDSEGSRINGYGLIDFKNNDFWRYATIEEAMEYDRLGKPFDTTKFIHSGSPKETNLSSTPDVYGKLIDKDIVDIDKRWMHNQMLDDMEASKRKMAEHIWEMGPSITTPAPPQQSYAVSGSVMMSMGTSQIFTGVDPCKDKILQAPALIVDKEQETFNLI